MKVLGVGDDKYICEVNYDELYELLGDAVGEEDYEIVAGDEIDLKRVVRAAHWIRQLDTEHIERIIRELSIALHGVEKVKETAQALNLFSKISNEEL